MSIVKFTLMSAIIAAIVIPSLRDKGEGKISTPVTTYAKEERIELDKLKDIQPKKEKLKDVEPRDEYLKLVLKEQRVSRASWSEGQLWVALLDIDNSKDKYAKYLCTLSKKYSISDKFTIVLYDYKKDIVDTHTSLAINRCVSH